MKLTIHCLFLVALSLNVAGQNNQLCYSGLSLSDNLVTSTVSPWYSTTGDFNNDGHKDIAFTMFSSSFIGIAAGYGNGKFAPTAYHSMPGQGWGITSADFNGDGIADIAVSSPQANQVYLFTGQNGNMPGTPVSFGGLSTPGWIRHGDFDADGKKDLAVISAGGTPGLLMMLKGTGTGSFTAWGTYTAGIMPQGLTVKDFNGDGRTDVAVASFSSNAVHVFLATTTGTFTGFSTYTVSSPNSVESGIINNDNYPDLVTTSGTTKSITVMYGSSSGTFAPGSVLTSTIKAYGGAVRDLNSDGFDDIVSASLDVSNILNVYLNNGSGGFSAPYSYFTGGTAYEVICDDMNKDLAPDIISPINGFLTEYMLVGINNGYGKFFLPVAANAGSDASAISTGDFNKDGKTDIVSANYSQDNISVILSGTDRRFLAPAIYSSTAKPNSIAVADFNNDGNLDLAVSNYSAQSITLYSGSSSGTFSQPILLPSAMNIWGIIANDFDLDGKQDIAVANFQGGGISIYKGNGNLTFGTAVNYTLGTNVGSTQMVSRDFNGDSFPDIAVLTNNGDVVILLGSNSGNFTQGNTYAAGISNYQIAAGDINNDQKLDLVIPSFNSDYLSIFYGQGNGTFSTQYTIAINNPHSVVVADYTGDQVDDIAVACLNTSELSIFKGVTNSNPVLAKTFYSYHFTRWMEKGDFDGDSKIDLSYASTDAQVKVLFNESAPLITITSQNTVCAGSPITLKGVGANTYSWSNGGNNVIISPTPLSTTTFTLYGTTYAGCSGSAVKTITVHALPAVSVSPATVNVCAGSTVVLTGSGAQAYTLSHNAVNGQTFIPVSSAIYSLTGTDLLGCSKTTTADVTVHAKPNVQIVLSNTLICAGNTVTLTATGATNYTWSTGPNSNQLILQPAATGTYAVSGTDQNKCTNSASGIVQVDACLKLSDQAGLNGILIFPNPSNGQLNIQVNTAERVLITDQLGKLIMSVDVAEGNNVLDLNGFSKGVYYLSFGEKPGATKVIIN